MLSQRSKLSQLSVDSAVVRGLMEFGPRDIRHLSKLMGVPYNRAIASYKRLRRMLGLQIRAAPNTDLLGLTHVFFEATLSPEYRRVGLQAFKGVSSLNYLSTNAISPTELFGILYVPTGPRREEYLGLFDELVDGGFLECYSIRSFPEIVRLSLRPEYVDWESGEYVFDWDSLTPRPAEPGVYDPSHKPLADRLDLLLLKELELDASKSFPEISEQLYRKHGVRVSDRLLLYHYENHLVPRKMFSKYRVLFSQSEKLGVYLLTQVAPSALDKYVWWVRRIPYLNRELLDPAGQHFSEHYLPSNGYQGFLGYVNSKLSPLATRMKMFVSLPGSRSGFSLPFELFDEESGEWIHDAHADAQRVLAKARELMGTA
ncbi:hypothetical protein B9Q08_03880 [Candidatus Marsarchaeota G2 archaeon ECH_B_SAG-M15]|uniref:AsnC family protein n=1 Tax=Candidatus Marsarchaeota G2 archaeon ECH_B_SAG-M15 TaxID=1978162 RepID=A0A2R6AWV7_9ARCH|nr:MAG: hypothetical protein B9Q08_03880 [Candidatus Marsarchaeota G2 archaeon ECH_B_SAG-M15]